MAKINDIQNRIVDITNTLSLVKDKNAELSAKLDAIKAFIDTLQEGGIPDSVLDGVIASLGAAANSASTNLADTQASVDKAAALLPA